MIDVYVEEDPIPHRGMIGITVAAVLLLAAFTGLGFTLFPDQMGKPIQQLLHPGSRLAFGEDRIAHIPAEFIRRSPLFAASWNALNICSKYDACDAAPIVALRDEAIKLDWPQIFDRLVVYDDWGGAQDSANARDDFFAAIKENGADTLRNDCFPNISFEVQDGGRAYFLNGFTCT